MFFLGAVVFQFGFTMFECVYSHVLKGVLYYGGASKGSLIRLFRRPHITCLITYYSSLRGYCSYSVCVQHGGHIVLFETATDSLRSHDSLSEQFLVLAESSRPGDKLSSDGC